MEDIPPSYYQSTNPSVLDLIAPYLDTASLHSLVLVSRFYNETFSSHLWGSPASHFVPVANQGSLGFSRSSKTQHSYDDIVYVALTRFKKILRVARESTRRLVHTLYLPAAASEIYSGPNATWLREILDGLPNLQSLCVSGLPFFDHHSLVAVERHRVSNPHQGHQTYPVKLLLASKEPNTTSIGLSLFLPHLCNLVYLDLSYTTPARDMNVLSSLAVLSDLRVLKLRGIALRDTEAEVLANAIGLRVRLLDLADNSLGDTAIRSLLQACFMHPTGITESQSRTADANASYSASSSHHSRRNLESWPVGLPPAPDFLSLDPLRSADFDKNLRVQLTNPLTGRLAFEDIPHSGLTHLYITGNAAVTIEGVKSLLEVGRLHVLDAGDVAGETAVDKYVKSVRHSGKWHSRTTSIGSAGASFVASRHSGGRESESDERLNFEDDMQLPGAEKLIPVLREKASNNLTYLRLEHSIVTKGFDLVKEQNAKSKAKTEPSTLNSGPNELDAAEGESALLEAPGSNRLAVEAPGSNYHAVELPSDPHVFEMDGTPAFRAELPGDMIHFALSPPIGDKPESTQLERTISPIRGVGPYAPEVVEQNQELSITADDNEISNATGFSPASGPVSPPLKPAPLFLNRARSTSTDTITMLQQETIIKKLPSSPPFGRQSQIQTLLQTRPSPSSPSLHPSHLPNLRTLILSNVPSQVIGPTSPILVTIREFIAACATEAHIAVLKAQTNYSLPPGRARAAAERKHAQSLFALKTIVLEVSPVQETRQRDWKASRPRPDISKSSTGDHDSEALWSAAENDFSFFGDAGEEHDECGIYEHEPGKYFPSIQLDDKYSLTADDTPTSSTAFNTISNMSLNSPTGTMFRSPRELPLGRNRRSSNETRNSDSPSFHGRTSISEMMGSSPPSRPIAPTSAPSKPKSEPQAIDLVSELSKWRKERKAAYEEELRRHSRVNGVTVVSRIADTEVYVPGHWKGEIKVVRNAKTTAIAKSQGRLERTGMVDVYGNYFEKGYLYS